MRKSRWGGSQPSTTVALDNIVGKSLNVLDIFLDYKTKALGFCNGSDAKLPSSSTANVNTEIDALKNIGAKQRDKAGLPADGGLPTEGVPINNNTARTVLEKRGATPDQSGQVIDSFDGQIKATPGKSGDKLNITESSPGEASGAFTTRGSAGTTPVERQTNLALPKSNTAKVEGKVELNRDQVLLEGNVASQAGNKGFPSTATGGGKQVFTDAHNGGVTRVKTQETTTISNPSTSPSNSVIPPLSNIDSPVNLTNGRDGHILKNHGPGAGKPGKTEFPSNWNNQRIMHQVSDIATDPNLTRQFDSRGTPYVIGVRDGIEIRVNFFPNNSKRAGNIATAYPINTQVNPKP